MRKLLPLFLILLVSAMAANAQDQSSANAGFNDDEAQNAAVATVASPEPAPAAAPQFGNGPEYGSWEGALGYQFSDFHPQRANRSFHNSGINLSVTRFFNEWFGVEGQLGLGFGHTGNATSPPNLVAKSTFLAGGLRFAYRSQSRWEPWGHVLFGLEHFRFTQGDVLGSNNAFALLFGGGVDYHLNSRLAIRGEGDYLGTHFFKAWERNLQIVGAIVLDF